MSYDHSLRIAQALEHLVRIAVAAVAWKTGIEIPATPKGRTPR